MRVGIMQPYFFPHIGYWQLLNMVDKYVIYDDVNYIKGGWINRNYILINGESKLITLCLNAASSNKLINEIEIKHNEIYNNKLLKTIKESYSKAPFIQDILPMLERLINYKENNLVNYLRNTITEVCMYLDIETQIILSSEINKNSKLKSQDKIIEICKLLEANQYINAIGGQHLYSKETFLQEGIELNFIKSKEINYRQFNNEFISNLSIIDIMMFNHPEKIKEMLNEYELK